MKVFLYLNTLFFVAVQEASYEFIHFTFAKLY
ncbi:MAG: hypothetical protein KatS3mg033_0127 [Thermonema sp.]|nr:MAG: hypothetical protein KatS3mg033_0127 [Thermonema sp.]